MLSTTPLFLSALAMLLQVGPNPAPSPTTSIPDILPDRSPRQRVVSPEAEPNTSGKPLDPRLAQCLDIAAIAPSTALEGGEEWLSGASGLERAYAAHCVGLAKSGLGDASGAAAAFIEARGNVPQDNPRYRAMLSAVAGNAHFADGNIEGALSDFEQAERDAAGVADPQEQSATLSNIAIDKARALVALSRMEEARVTLDNARTLNPKNPEAWLLSATLSRRLNQLDVAQSQILRAADLDPRNPATGLEAGVIAALAGNEDAARKSWQSVILVAPDTEIAEQAQNYLTQLDQNETTSLPRMRETGR